MRLPDLRRGKEEDEIHEKDANDVNVLHLSLFPITESRSVDRPGKVSRTKRNSHE
jgi:hypothetical protein